MPAIVTVLVGLGQNMALLFAVLWLYRLLYPYERAGSSHVPALVLGGLVGGLGLLGVTMPIVVTPGVVIDGRTLLVVLVSAWAGPFAALAAGSLGALYRLWLGDPAMGIIGAGSIISGAVLGTLAWYWRGRYPIFRPSALILLGLGSAIIAILWVLLLPAEISGPALANSAIPVLVAYPTAALIFGTVFAQDRRRADAEAALRISEARYRTLASHFPNGAVLLFDHDLRFILAEGAGLAEAGLSKASLEGQTIGDVFPSDIYRLLEPAYRAALAGTPLITEVPFQDRVYRVYTLPVPDTQGRITAGMAMSQDITADRQAQLALKQSKERYARLADAAFEGIGICENNIIFDANARLAEMVGYTQQELVGMPTEQIVAPESRDLVRRRVQAGYQSMYEHLALRKDGSVFPVEVRSRRLHEQSQTMRVTVVRDISDRVTAQQALAESELRFRGAFHAHPTPQILTHAADGTFLDVNAAYERLVGWSRDELLGRRTTDLPLWVNLDRAELMADLAAAGRIRDRPTQARDRAGALHDLVLSIEPVQLGDVRCLLCVMIDVTKRKRAEEELRLIQGTTLAISATSDLPAALGIALQYVCEATGWVLGQAWTACLDAALLECSVAWPDDVPELEPFRRASKALALPPGVGLPGQVWQSREATWIQDVTQDTNFPRAAIAQEAGIKAGVAFPVLAGTDVVAVLEFFVREPRAEDAQLINLISTVAAQLGTVIQRKQAEDALRASEAALRDSEARFRAMFERAAIGISLVDMSGKLILANPALEAMLGYHSDELCTMTFAALTHPSDVEADVTLFGELIAGARESYRIEKRYLRKDGQVVWGHLAVSLVRDNAAEPRFAIGMVEDITESKRIQQQYLQAQKMDAIGRLAGGVAHDFNNLLTVMIGSSDLLLDELGPSHPLRSIVTPIQDAAARAAALTRQLLAFSRQQVLQPDIVNLNSVVARVEALLQRLIGEDITLVTHCVEDLGTVRADPSQLEQVLLNLAVNARDAMTNGGTLIIETANVLLDASYAHESGGVNSGHYVLLAISDTGTGMDAATQARIFEPFFTTKAPGKGTGLGLATVYGIVQQSGGYIWVYSEVGNGTTFKVYLPQATTPATIIQPAVDLAPAPHDSGIILLVEDDALVRALAGRILRTRGYQVLEAHDGATALHIAAAHRGQIDVLLTDVIMPGGLSGPQVAEQLLTQQAGLRVLYMSGYTDTMIAHHAAFDPRQNLLQKPFTPTGLVRAVWNARYARPQENVDVYEADEKA